MSSTTTRKASGLEFRPLAGTPQSTQCSCRCSCNRVHRTRFETTNYSKSHTSCMAHLFISPPRQAMSSKPKITDTYSVMWVRCVFDEKCCPAGRVCLNVYGLLYPFLRRPGERFFHRRAVVRLMMPKIVITPGRPCRACYSGLLSFTIGTGGIVLVGRSGKEILAEFHQ